MANEAAKKVINAYLQEAEPGYALLIDAPWGSGKTHTVKSITGCDRFEDRLYVTLYDVHSPESFDWAIVRAVNPWAESRNSAIFKQLKKFVSGLQICGSSIDLSGVNISEVVLQNLPDTIIFDDLERCTMPHAELSGLLNRFVEHKKKRVILIASTDKHAEKESFNSSREKVIGRAITLEPDVNAAIIANWVKIDDGIGRTTLMSRQKLIVKIFEEAGHQNLRLLLRSLRECATMLNVLPLEFFRFERSIDRLIMTFVALHMAYHGGELSKDDIKNRASINLDDFVPAENDDERTVSRLSAIQKRHPDSNIKLGYADIFPLELAYGILVDGYVDSEVVVDALKGTHQFQDSRQKPDWVRLWEWDQEKHNELQILIDRLKVREKRLEVVEPGEILQIHGARNFISKFLLKEDRKMQARKTLKYIEKLSMAGLIKPAVASSTSQGRYGFSIERDRISYSGYAFEPDRRDLYLAHRLMREMDQAFEDKIGDLSDRLMSEMRDTPEKFIERFNYNSRSEDFSQTPILHRLPADEFARILIQFYEFNNIVACSIAQKLSARRDKNRGTFAIEAPWFEKLEKNLVDQANANSELMGAQIRLFIQWHLKPS